MMSRALEHGTRRAEEMREAAHTVAEVGIAPLMATATAERQDFSARFPEALAGGTVAGMVDLIRARMATVDMSTADREKSNERIITA